MIPENTLLFQNFTAEEYDDLSARGCLRSAIFEKNTPVFKNQEKNEETAVLLWGQVLIESYDLWGKRILLHCVSAGEAFAETYAFCNAVMTVNATAAQKSEILFLNIKKAIDARNSTKSWYAKLLYNTLQLCAEKNLYWTSRMMCITQKSIRSRVMIYLSSQAVQCGSLVFTVPFNRQQMADYLNVERSALSKELGRMQKEGLLYFSKNKFRLLHTVPIQL